MDGTTQPVLLSPVNAAKALDCSRATIYQLIKLGRIKVVLIGSDRRIPYDEVQRIAREGASTKAA